MVKLLIRPYKASTDARALDALMNEATMSTIWPTFMAVITKEFTIQMIVMSMAVLFVAVGSPLLYCALSLPAMILLIFLVIWCGHRLKVMKYHEDLKSIEKTYQSHSKTGFWVVEVVEGGEKDLKVDFVFENEGESSFSSASPTIVGSVAICIKKDPDLRDPPESVAWLRRMAVSKRYQRKGIGERLVDVALNHCKYQNFIAVELLTTEFHDSARSLYAKKGFEMVASVRKEFIFGWISWMLYTFRYHFSRS